MTPRQTPWPRSGSRPPGSSAASPGPLSGSGPIGDLAGPGSPASSLALARPGYPKRALRMEAVCRPQGRPLTGRGARRDRTQVAAHGLAGPAKEGADEGRGHVRGGGRWRLPAQRLTRRPAPQPRGDGQRRWRRPVLRSRPVRSAAAPPRSGPAASVRCSPGTTAGPTRNCPAYRPGGQSRRPPHPPTPPCTLPAAGAPSALTAGACVRRD
jgi:hypothetical protein